MILRSGSIGNSSHGGSRVPIQSTWLSPLVIRSPRYSATPFYVGTVIVVESV